MRSFFGVIKHNSHAEMDEDELEKLIQSGYTDEIYQVYELLQDD